VERKKWNYDKFQSFKNILSRQRLFKDHITVYTKVIARSWPSGLGR
jgi:hypothetical protein